MRMIKDYWRKERRKEICRRRKREKEIIRNKGERGKTKTSWRWEEKEERNWRIEKVREKIDGGEKERGKRKRGGIEVIAKVAENSWKIARRRKIKTKTWKRKDSKFSQINSRNK